MNSITRVILFVYLKWPVKYLFLIWYSNIIKYFRKFLPGYWNENRLICIVSVFVPGRKRQNGRNLSVYIWKFVNGHINRQMKTQITSWINTLFLVFGNKYEQICVITIVTFSTLVAIYTVMMRNNSCIYLLDHVILYILWYIYYNKLRAI